LKRWRGKNLTNVLGHLQFIQEDMMSQGTRKIRFGLWYDFRNPAQWRRPADRLYREILDQIAWSENNGFDDVWLSEHHFIEDGYLPSILPVAAAIAARTDRIRIASGVLLMPFHNPIRLAEDVATVDVISGGRFELGVGIGFKREEFTGFGVSSKERGARTDQSLDIIRRALSGETITFKSEFFDFQNIKVTPEPVQKPRPPSGSAASRRRRCAARSVSAMVSPCPGQTEMYMTAMSPS
jgi:alkanesulfonate monooxygenase SsuD/methylene tetrahydromethanopterin reductase-like flavin-dependent oxidoreductase (luciferase family)